MADNSDFLNSLMTGVGQPAQPSLPSPLDPNKLNADEEEEEPVTPASTAALRAPAAAQSQVDDSDSEDNTDLAPEEAAPAGAMPSPADLSMSLNVGSALMAKPSATNYASLSPSELVDTYRQLKEAQDKRKSAQSNLGYLMAGNQLSQAFARKYGAQIGDGSDAVKMLQAQADQPVTDVKDKLAQAQEAMKAANTAEGVRQEQRMADPDSDVSKLYRLQAYGLAKKTDPTFVNEGQFDSMSALDLQKLMASGAKNMAQMGKLKFHPVQMPDGTVHLKAFNDVTGESTDEGLHGSSIKYRIDPVTGSMVPLSGSNINSFGNVNPNAQKIDPNKEVELTDINSLAPKQQKAIVGIRQDFEKDVKPLRDVSSAISNLAEKVNIGDPNATIDSGLLGAIQAQSARAGGMKGVLTDQHMDKYAGAGGVEARLKRLTGKQLGEISPEDKQFFTDYINLMAGAAQKDLTNRSQIYADRIKSEGSVPQRGINLNDAAAQKLLLTNSMLPMQDLKAANTQAAKAKDSEANLVTIQGPSGQTVKMTKDKAQKYLSKPGYKLVGE